MGQEIRGVPEAASLTGSSDEPAIGPYLARQRRLRGISLEDLSARTKIPRRSLERLEAGAFDRAADGFARGFVRTVAAALGLDPDDAVTRLLSEPAEEEGEDERRSRSLRQAVALGTAVALAAGALAVASWGLRAAYRSDDTGSAEARVLYRRDAVRALADALAVDAGGEGRSEAEPSEVEDSPISSAEPGAQPSSEPHAR